MKNKPESFGFLATAFFGKGFTLFFLLFENYHQNAVQQLKYFKKAHKTTPNKKTQKTTYITN